MQVSTTLLSHGETEAVQLNYFPTGDSNVVEI